MSGLCAEAHGERTPDTTGGTSDSNAQVRWEMIHRLNIPKRTEAYLKHTTEANRENHGKRSTIRFGSGTVRP